MARIESVSSVLRQKHTAVGEFRTHTSFENRLGGPTLNHLRYGDRHRLTRLWGLLFIVIILVANAFISLLASFLTQQR